MELSEAPTIKVDWPNPPTVADLKQNLMDALPSHNTQVAKIDEWKRQFHAKHKDTSNPKQRKERQGSRFQPRVIRKSAEWRYAPLSEPFLGNPSMFSVEPTTAEDVDRARQNKIILNKQFNTEIDKVALVDECVRVGVEEGTVLLKAGWINETRTEERNMPVWEFRVDPTVLPLHQELEQLFLENPSLFYSDVPDELQEAHQYYLDEGVPYAPIQVGNEMQDVEIAHKNHPTVTICDYRNLVIDPS